MTTITQVRSQLKEDREKLEALIWELTEWRGRPETVDRLMSAIDLFASLKAEFLRTTEPNRHRSESVVAVERAITSIEAHQESLPVVDNSAIDVIALGTGKVCRACGVPKTFDEYNKDRTRKDGYLSKCKTCVKNKVQITLP